MRSSVFVILVLLISCINKTQNEQSSSSSENAVGLTEDHDPLKDSKESESIEIHPNREPIQIDHLNLSDLSSSKWTCSVAPGCTDTLLLNINQEGREYRCEMLIDNKIIYDVRYDTLFIQEYGLVSEIDASKGEEVKYTYKYVLINESLRMVVDQGISEFIYKQN
ncbi:hypothetical protein [Fulvivirga ligni]|uniref:hypothetical protein n=1 Tax=Fulvivirga ligni TaxID=2904246 RepID=UPI001F381857|nr:hypothetical protein [Fulvivirga ligni]UII20498.1 hypothetical protein LVD16_21910 [Fulvivirga ligni]